MSMKVLHLIGGGEIGGAEQNVLNLLLQFDPEKVTAELVCLVKDSPLASLAKSKGINTVVFPMGFPLDLSPVLPLVRYCRKNNIELLHCHGIRANLIGRIAARFLAKPSISTIHSQLERDYTSSWKAALAMFLENLTLPFTSGLITVSNDLRKSVGTRLHRRESLPIKTIYNGCSPLDFSYRDEWRDDFRNKMNISEHSKVIGTIGRLHPVKGQAYLVEAFKLLSKEFSDLHLLIIGEGPLHSQLQDLLDTYQLPYTMTGFLPSSWQALPAMDIFVLPSLSEGMGLVLLEAAQAEVPIIASRVGGIPELFTDNSEALLVKPADPVELTLALSRLLNDANLSKKLTENARARVSSFSLDKMLEETIDFYENVLHNYQKHRS